MVDVGCAGLVDRRFGGERHNSVDMQVDVRDLVEVCCHHLLGWKLLQGR